jgi:hypothetical protein
VVAFATGVGSYYARKQGWTWVEGLAANLSAGFLGAFLTVVLIDRALEKERSRQVRRATALALGRLRPCLLAQLELLASWYKAAAQEPCVPARDAKTFFTEEYFREVQYLDFSKPGPQAGSNWFWFSGQIFHEFQTKIQTVLDAYAPLVNTETLELLERILASPIPTAIMGLARLPETDAAQGTRRCYNMLAGPGVIDELQRYASLLHEFIEHFNRVAARGVSPVELLAWRDDVSPKWGSGRLICSQLDRDAVKYMMGPAHTVPKMRSTADKDPPNAVS